MSHPPSSQAAGVFCVVATLLSWSVVPLLLFYFVKHVDVWTSNGWRYAFAAIFWLPVLVLGLRRRKLRGLWRACVVPASFNILGQVAFAAAHYQIDPGLVTFGLRFQIVCVTIGAALLFPDERAAIRRPLFLLGIVMVLGGTISTIWTDEGFGSQQNTIGVLLALAAGLLFAGYSIGVRRCLSPYPSILAFSAISQITAVAMILLMVIFGARSGLDALAMSDGNFALFILSAVIGIAFGHVLFYLALARLGVAAATGVIQLQPFGTAIGATLLFQEPLTVAQWIGGTIAVGGAMLILFVQSRVARKRSETIERSPVAIEERVPESCELSAG